MGFGEQLVLPLLDEIEPLYPEIALDVSFSDELKSLEHDEVDVAIRASYAPQQSIRDWYGDNQSHDSFKVSLLLAWNNKYLAISAALRFTRHGFFYFSHAET